MIEKVCVHIKVKIEGLITSMSLDPDQKYTYFYSDGDLNQINDLN